MRYSASLLGLFPVCVSRDDSFESPIREWSPFTQDIQRTRATTSCDSMESQFSCAALPDMRSGQPPRRPPLRRGSPRSAAASPLPLPLACEERRGASHHRGRRSRAQQHRLRRKRRIFRWGALSRDGPPGLSGDIVTPMPTPMPASTPAPTLNLTATQSPDVSSDTVENHCGESDGRCLFTGRGVNC